MKKVDKNSPKMMKKEQQFTKKLHKLIVVKNSK